MAGASQMFNETWQEGELLEWHGAEIIFISVTMIMGLVGNMLVLYIYHFRWRSNTVTLIKRMLAVLDLASLLLAHPSLLYMVLVPNSPSFHPTCVFASVVALGTAIASSCVLIIIAVDRFMRLCLLRKKGVGTDLSQKLFAASLLFAAVVVIPCGWTFEKSSVFLLDYKVQFSYCYISNESSQRDIVLISFAIFSVVFVAVFISLVVLYYKIVRTLQELGQMHEQLKHKSSITRRFIENIREQNQGEVMRNSAIVFIAVTVVFFSSYCPYFVTFVLSWTHPDVTSAMTPVLKAVYDLTKYSPLINNMANPIIYSFTSKYFRDEVRKTLSIKNCNSSFFQRKVCSFKCKSQEVSMSSIARGD